MHVTTKAATVNLYYRGTQINPHTQNLTAGLQLTAKIKRSDYKIGTTL